MLYENQSSYLWNNFRTVVFQLKKNIIMIIYNYCRPGLYSQAHWTHETSRIQSLFPGHITRMIWHKNLYFLDPESRVVNFTRMMLIHKLCDCIDVLLWDFMEVCTIKYTKTWSLVILSFHCSKSSKSKMLCPFFPPFPVERGQFWIIFKLF